MTTEHRGTGRVRVGLISTTIAAVGPMIEEFRRQMPEADLLHLLDEGLVVEFGRAGGLSRAAKFRTLELVLHAEEAGSRVIACSCSTLSPVFDELTPFSAVPMVTIDGEMARQACAMGDRVAILVSAESVLLSVLPTFAKAAASVGRSPELVPRVLTEIRRLPRSSPAAFEAIARAALDALREADLVVIGQCSMAGCMTYIPEDVARRVMTGAPCAVAAVKRLAEAAPAEWGDPA